jgi:modulator of FtsH protease HflK
MPWANGGDGNKTTDRRGLAGAGNLENLLKRSLGRLKRLMPGGSRQSNSIVFVSITVLAAIIAFGAFTFRVDPDELGVVTFFGKPIRQEPPGLHFRLPYPIEEVYLPKVTKQNIIEVGVRTSADTRRGSQLSQESLMLTGDENIVDINFVVYWRIKPEDVQSYLFNIQNSEVTVKEVAQSAMREVVGQNNIQPILTEARQKTEQDVQKLMQDVLDSYRAGIRVDQVRLQKVDPPTQVIDAFRDVQAARADQERLQNEAYTYANRVVPEARGEAERILQGARAYKDQAVAEATGQTARFLQVYKEYKKAPEVTRRRMYLETMERVLGGTDKIILDNRSGQGVVPLISLGRKKEVGGANHEDTNAKQPPHWNFWMSPRIG